MRKKHVIIGCIVITIIIIVIVMLYYYFNYTKISNITNKVSTDEDTYVNIETQRYYKYDELRNQYIIYDNIMQEELKSVDTEDEAKEYINMEVDNVGKIDFESSEIDE